MGVPLAVLIQDGQQQNLGNRKSKPLWLQSDPIVRISFLKPQTHSICLLLGGKRLYFMWGFIGMKEKK